MKNPFSLSLRGSSRFLCVAAAGALLLNVSESLALPPLTFPATDFAEQAPGRAGGALYASASYEAGSLDIHTRHAGNLLWEARLLFDNLVYLDPAGNPTPWLAKSWSVSPDGLSYTFRLREDVTFSDGVRFDAEAVRTNFDRIKALGLLSRIASAYLAPYAEGRVLDDFTFQARLSEPYPAFLSYLAQTWLGFISPRQIRDAPATIALHPVGTGAFVVTEHEPEKRAVFRRRADYAWSPEVLHHRGAAYLNGIVLEAVPSDADRTAALIAGRHQLTFEAPLPDCPRLRAEPGLVFSNRVRPGSPMRGLAFNPRRFPFNDVRIRRAAALAIDRSTVTRLIGGDEFIPKSDYLGTNTPGYDPAFRGALAYDPQRANALLDETGWQERATDGIRVKDGRRLAALLVTTGTERTPPASVLAMQADLRRAGLELRIASVAGDRLADVIRTGDYDALTGGWWSAVTPDVLFLLYHSSQIARQNTFGQDTARLADPSLDAALLNARHAADPEKRQAYYRDAQRLLTELVPAVPLHESHHLIAYDRRLRGLLFDTTHQTPLLTTAWLERETP